MSGQASLIVVIGFAAIFLVMGLFWANLSTRSVDNSVSYYEDTVARNIAVSGANMGLSELARDSNWVSSISNRDFEKGKMTVTITALGPPNRTLTSVGTFMGVNHTVKVNLVRDTKLYEEDAWSINSVSTGSGQWGWRTGDSIWGGFHSNQFLVVDGNPVFFGKVTTMKGIQDQAKKPSPPSNPQFLGGYQSGINIPWTPVNGFADQMTAALNGQAQGGTCYFDGSNLWLTFNADGTVTYRTAPKNAGDSSSAYSTPVTLPLSTMAPTGVIYLQKANLFLSGTLSGKMTVVCDGGSGTGQGNIYLTGDMVYKTDPMIPNGAGGYKPNPNSKDMLGIAAANDILIATSAQSGGKANNVDNPDIHIDAAMFSLGGGLTVQNLGSAPANKPLGSIYLQGSMSSGKEGIVAQLDNKGNITAGYKRNIIYDSRLSLSPPTWFPLSCYYRIASWLE
jgi:hypothetical protein